MPLTAAQFGWLDTDGRRTLKLTGSQVRMLHLVLERETFSFQEIGRLVGISRAGAAAALHRLERRGLLRLTRTRRSLTRSPHQALPGHLLDLIFNSLTVPGEAPAKQHVEC